MKKGDKAMEVTGVWSAILIVMIVVGCFSWAAGSKIRAEIYYDGSLYVEEYEAIR